MEQGCDYCFWMIHYRFMPCISFPYYSSEPPRNRQSQTAISLNSPISTERSEDNPDSLDTNLVCMFKESSSNCPALVERVKSNIESKISSMEPTYSKYANFPSCSSRWVASERYLNSFQWLVVSLLGPELLPTAGYQRGVGPLQHVQVRKAILTPSLNPSPFSVTAKAWAQQPHQGRAVVHLPAPPARPTPSPPLQHAHPPQQPLPLASPPLAELVSSPSLTKESSTTPVPWWQNLT